VIAAVAFIAMTIYNFKLALIYCGILATCFVLYRVLVPKKNTSV
jgi:hypothetical protein